VEAITLYLISEEQLVASLASKI